MENGTETLTLKSMVLLLFLIIKYWNVCFVYMQDFADDLDVMPTVTLENNVIHNNEGYGVIVVKPNNVEQHKIPLNRCEGR